MNGDVAAQLRRTLVDAPGSWGARTRAERWRLVDDVFPNISELAVIDLGGTVEAWRRAPVRPARLTVLNLFEPGQSDEERVRAVTGDACRARQALAEAGAATAYDLVFSNSLLEHVGGHCQRVALAREVHALAPHHWVQTPYRYFPIEPHWLFPGLQFLPIAARAKLAARWPLAHSSPETDVEAMSEVQWTELVGLAEMRSYFPSSRIHREKVAGVTKSLIAVRGGAAARV